MEGINGTVIPGVGEGNWNINSATGEITCDLEQQHKVLTN